MAFLLYKKHPFQYIFNKFLFLCWQIVGKIPPKIFDWAANAILSDSRYFDGICFVPFSLTINELAHQVLVVWKPKNIHFPTAHAPSNSIPMCIRISIENTYSGCHNLSTRDVNIKEYDLHFRYLCEASKKPLCVVVEKSGGGRFLHGKQ